MTVHDGERPVCATSFATPDWSAGFDPPAKVGSGTVNAYVNVRTSAASRSALETPLSTAVTTIV